MSPGWLTHSRKGCQTVSSLLPSPLTLLLALFLYIKSINSIAGPLFFVLILVHSCCPKEIKRNEDGLWFDCPCCAAFASVGAMPLLKGGKLCNPNFELSQERQRMVGLSKEENPWKPGAQIRRIQHQCSYSWGTRQTGHLLHSPTCQDWHCGRNRHWFWPSCGSSSRHGCSPSAGTYNSFELDWEFGWMGFVLICFYGL